MQNICNFLESKTYPGRGIYVSKSPDNNSFWCAYWTMGRSEGSRNRVFSDINSETQNERIFQVDEKLFPKHGVSVDIADMNKCDAKNPWLLYYNPLIQMPEYNSLIIANGDQSDTIYCEIMKYRDWKKGFYEALLQREFEDDSPNYTPRISAIINTKERTFDFSILKRGGEEHIYCERNFYHYDDYIPNFEGRLITTYVDDGSPLPSFNTDPIPLKHTATSIKQFMDSIWESLNEDNKVSLLVSEASFDSNHVRWLFINKYEKVEDNE